MPALVAGIHVLNPRFDEDVDGRNKPGQFLSQHTFSRTFIHRLCAWRFRGWNGCVL